MKRNLKSIATNYRSVTFFFVLLIAGCTPPSKETKDLPMKEGEEVKEEAYIYQTNRSGWALSGWSIHMCIGSSRPHGTGLTTGKRQRCMGKTGYVFCRNANDVTIMEDEQEGPYSLQPFPIPNGLHDPFAYLNRVVKGGHPVEPFGLSSMENNYIVMQILEAARHAANTGKTVKWETFFEK